MTRRKRRRSTIVAMTTRLLNLDAVLFDLDGVLTSTAGLHAAAWKTTFDELLERLSRAGGGTQRPFDDEDYRRYVDGRPRADGVRSFLASRGMELPAGDGDDSPQALTVAAVAGRKDALFQERVAAGAVLAFPGSVALLRELRRGGVKTAVVSASRHCSVVLEAAGIDGMFEAQVDGEVAARLGLRGKPAPDTFLEAARMLHVAPTSAAVIEDAIAGVEAGHAGGFAVVIGVDRTGTPQELIEHGADLVVQDLAELLEDGGEGGRP